MTDPPSSISASNFFAIAADLGFITDEEAQVLSERAGEQKKSASEFAIDSGYMGSTQVDIVKALDSPTEVVPGYKVEALLGQGGMGVVYRAEQLNLGRQVALKTIIVNRMGDASVISRFEREAKTIGQLRHPNIVSAFDFGSHSGRLFLALELVEGRDLDFHIKKHGSLDEFTALQFTRQAAAGLSHAENLNVVHRDIKPANLILVDPPEGYPLPSGVPMVKVADFGLALLQSEKEETRLTSNATLGTPNYMSPEQLESSSVDFRADIYSLGASLVHMLTGKPPFHGMKLSQIVAAKFQGKVTEHLNLSKSLHPLIDRLIQKMMERNPEDRQQSYESLIHEIDIILPKLTPQYLEATDDLMGTFNSAEADTPTAEFTPPTVQMNQQEIRKHSRFYLFSSFLALLFIASAGGAIYVMNGNPDRSAQILPFSSPTARVVGKSQLLLNGTDTGGWIVDHGSWIWSKSKAALEGTNGVIRRKIPSPQKSVSSQSGPMPSYRLEILLANLDGEARQELHFGISSDDSARYLLRRSKDSIELTSHNAELGEETLHSMVVSSNKMVAITLDRLRNGWFIEVNGEQAAAVQLQEKELPEFQLKAIGGPVYFSDIVISELSISEESSSQ